MGGLTHSADCRSHASAVACVASSENRFPKMSRDASKTDFVVMDPSVSNSITIRVGSFAAFTDSTLYCSRNFAHVTQSAGSSSVSSSSVDVDYMWLSQYGTFGSSGSIVFVPAFRIG